ncbi:methyltransferase domain-containing protein [Ferrovibrio sp.]|uniref:class I SAM-dependent methyltransferase n=1 Tax=Ferrovibrio sp. TaxID=1917215 RepID=UPI00311D5813
MTVVAKENPEQDGEITWREKLRAWWHGDDYAMRHMLPDEMPEAVAPEAGGEPAVPVETPTIERWTPRRQQIVQRLFGEGFNQPGGEELMKTLTQPLGLNPNMSITELGSGMGGMSRMLARDGLWIDAYEPDPDLFTAAGELARSQGLRQRTNLKNQPLDDLKFKRKSIDVFLSKEGLMSVQDKRLLLAKIRAAMKPGGQLMLTDFLLTGPTDSRIYEVWWEREPVKPHLLTPEGLQAELESLNFVICYIEDVSHEVKSAVIDAFSGYDRDLKLLGKNINENERDWVISEGEHWAIRISAMDANIVRLYRIYCRVVD